MSTNSESKQQDKTGGKGRSPNNPGANRDKSEKYQYLQQSRKMIRATLDRYVKMLTQIR